MNAYPVPKPKRTKSINTRWRSPKYLAWVRNQLCCLCFSPGPIHAHHIKGVGHLSGVGLKAPDWAVMPLCHKCHTEMHHNPELWPKQLEMVVWTLGKAIDEGVLRIS
jgi:hypothetical protein